VRYGVAFCGLVLALGIIAGESDAQVAGGKQPDPVAALQSYRLAAAQGDPAALDGLGSLFETGSGVPVDFAKAYTLFHLAASRQGADRALVTRASEHRDTLGSRMSPAQLARVRDLIDLCNGSDVNRCGEIILSAGGLVVATVTTQASRDGKMAVRLEESNGTYFVPGIVNGIMNLRFLIDTGATDVGIPADVVASMVMSGFIEQADFLGERTYSIANGSTMPAQTFRIRSLKVGNMVIEDVRANVLPAKGPLLLGQSFLRRLKSWSLDNTAHILTIE